MEYVQPQPSRPPGTLRTAAASRVRAFPSRGQPSQPRSGSRPLQDSIALSQAAQAARLPSKPRANVRKRAEYDYGRSTVRRTLSTPNASGSRAVAGSRAIAGSRDAPIAIDSDDEGSCSQIRTRHQRTNSSSASSTDNEAFKRPRRPSSSSSVEPGDPDAFQDPLPPWSLYPGRSGGLPLLDRISTLPTLPHRASSPSSDCTDDEDDRHRWPASPTRMDIIIEDSPMLGFGFAASPASQPMQVYSSPVMGPVSSPLIGALQSSPQHLGGRSERVRRGSGHG